MGCLLGMPILKKKKEWRIRKKGRRSLAEKFYERVERDYEEERGTWLVLYDFKGVKANSKFWTNMKRVENLVDGGLPDPVQRLHDG